jgi:hypothetical protein
LPGTFAYQTTDQKTNAVTGIANTPVDIPGNNGSQSFVIAFTPSAAIPPMDLAFNFACSNTSPAPIQTGLNTPLFSASTTATPDVIALDDTERWHRACHRRRELGRFSRRYRQSRFFRYDDGCHQ